MVFKDGLIKILPMVIEQHVSNIANISESCSIYFVPMTDSMWVTLKISVEGRLHLFYDQQFVSDIAQFVKAGLITPFPLINREWVRLVILLRTVSSHLCLLSTGGKGHCLLCEGQSHHICFYDQQEVSGPDIAHVVKGSLITSYPVTNSKWVTLHIVWVIASFPITNSK